jgi:hypothetical protein
MYVNYSWTVALLDGVPAEALLDGVQEPGGGPRTSTSNWRRASITNLFGGNAGSH